MGAHCHIKTVENIHWAAFNQQQHKATWKRQTLIICSIPVQAVGKFYSPLPNDQLLKTLTEKNRQWFSLLPRTPCDDTSLTHAGMSAAALKPLSLSHCLSHLHPPQLRFLDHLLRICWPKSICFIASSG